MIISLTSLYSSSLSLTEMYDEVEIMSSWLEEHIGDEHYGWKWMRPSSGPRGRLWVETRLGVEIDKEEDAVAFRLRFGL